MEVATSASEATSKIAIHNENTQDKMWAGETWIRFKILPKSGCVTQFFGEDIIFKKSEGLIKVKQIMLKRRRETDIKKLNLQFQNYRLKL